MTGHQISDPLRRKIEAALQGTSLGVMVYGSVARGTAGAYSDVDVLQLRSQEQFPYRLGRVSVSAYTPEFLTRLARQGSLFVLHLRTDAIVESDPHGLIEECLAEYARPQNYDAFRRKLCSAARLLHIDVRTFAAQKRHYSRLALFFLRSTLFAECAERGQPEFSIQVISQLYNDPRIATAYSAKYDREPDWRGYLATVKLVEEYLDTSVTHDFSSIQRLLLSEPDNDILTSLGLRLIKQSEPVEFYAGLRMRLGIDNNKGSQKSST